MVQSSFSTLFVCQLGEAILTERVPQSEPVSIRLIDARSPQTRTLEEEQRFLVAGGDSDDDDDAKDEEEKLQEKNSLLTHSGARVSRNDLTEVEEDDGYESLAGVLRPHGGSGRRGHEGGTLSSKAGIILVRFFISFFCSLVRYSTFTGYSKHLYRHSPIPRHRFFCHSLRDSRSCEAWASCTCTSSPSGSCDQRHTGIVKKYHRFHYRDIKTCGEKSGG